MRFFKHLLFVILTIFSLPAAASVNSYVEAIKKNPKTLYAFFKAMPKGGELHYHLAGGIYPEILLSLAAQHHYCINPKTYNLSSPHSCDGINAAKLSKNTKLYREVINTWSMNDKAFGKKSDHDQFFSAFLKYMPLVLDYPPQLLANIMKRAASQHELYLEIQMLADNADSAKFGKQLQYPMSDSIQLQTLLANKKFQANIQHTITESDRILKTARKNLNCDTAPQQPVCKLTVKFQYFILREQPLRQIFAQALNGFIAASKSKNIVGINLVQAEDGLISMRDYKQQMKIFKYLHDVYPQVNIALHAGELVPSTSYSSQPSTHIYDAIFTGHANRIGHGVNIGAEVNAKKILQYMHKIPIPVEINLTSNRKILGVTGKKHPLNQYLAHGVPVVLSTDDEGILRTNLTHEYVEAVHTHHLTYSNIKTINRNALTYSFLPGKSLWAIPEKEKAVPECQHFESLKCLTFIKANQKAQLQWQLEQQLTLFEKAYSSN